MSSLPILQVRANVGPEFKAIADRIDRELEADRRFFKRRPKRSYRVRRAFPNEREAMRLTWGDTWPFEGRTMFVAVWQATPGLRTRAFFGGDPHFETAMTEEAARAIYETISNPDFNARIRKAAKLKRGARS